MGIYIMAQRRMSRKMSRKTKRRGARSTCKRTMGGDAVEDFNKFFKKFFEALDGMRQFINGKLNEEDHKDALKIKIQEFTNSSKVSCRYDYLFEEDYVLCKKRKAMYYYALGFALLTQKKLYGNDDELALLIMRNFSKAEKHAKAAFSATSDEKLRGYIDNIEVFLKHLMNQGILRVDETWTREDGDNPNREIYNKLTDKKEDYHEYKYGQHEGEQNE